MSKMSELDITVRNELDNLFPGHPPKPMGYTNSGTIIKAWNTRFQTGVRRQKELNTRTGVISEAHDVLPSHLDEYGTCQWTEKWDEHRVILYNGLAFSRVGALYSKLPDTYTSEVAKYLEKCFKVHEYFIFDVGFMSHGPMKGTCFLYDIPQHKGAFRERNAIMRACNESFATTIIGNRELNGRVVLPVSGEDKKMTGDQLYADCLSRSQGMPLLDQLEGVVGKPWDHVYQFSPSEAMAKQQGWKKVRFK